ncbi:MAG: hypothetical protein Kow00106_24230 [Anaerolineae bacterium]
MRCPHLPFATDGIVRWLTLQEYVFMKELVEYIAKSLVEDPGQVRVTETRHGNMTVLELEVAPDDMGRIIGKNGRVANAIRVLVRVPAAKQGKRVSLDIV